MLRRNEMKRNDDSVNIFASRLRSGPWPITLKYWREVV